MILSIIIEGESADELFGVGPNDLKNHFLPKDLNVKAEDVTQVAFKEVTEWDDGLPAEYLVHKENIYRPSHDATQTNPEAKEGL